MYLYDSNNSNIYSSAFVYKWTEIATGKWYIGSRTAKGCHQSDGYICSSKIVKPMILENKAGWVREILATGDADAMLSFELALLQKINAKCDPMSYNKTNGCKDFYDLGRLPESLQKRKDTVAKRSVEEKAALSKHFSDTYHRKPESVKQEHKRKMSEIQHSKSDEQKAEFSRKMSNIRNNKSPEEKTAYSIKMSELRLKCSDSQKASRRQKIAATYSNKTPLEKAEISAKHSLRQIGKPKNPESIKKRTETRRINAAIKNKKY